MLSDPVREYYSVLCDETNPIENINALLGKLDRSEGIVPLADRRVVRIERLRLIGYCAEFPEWEVSYCFGALADGRLVRVDLGDTFLRRDYKTHLVELCQAAGRHGELDIAAIIESVDPWEIIPNHAL